MLSTPRPPGAAPARAQSATPAATGEGIAKFHPLEIALLAVVGAHLVVLPWALGTMHVWSQLLSLGFGLLGFVLAIQPRHYAGGSRSGVPFYLHTLPALLRFPVFWLGLIFLLYIVVQGLNPAWEYVPAGRGFWLKGLPHVGWLPSGMRTPFAHASPWRSLVVYGSVWLAVCAVWTGLTRRRGLRLLLSILAVNAFLLAFLGLLERAGHATRIFWVWTPPAEYFVSSFIYRNHAGAYFDLLLAVTGAVAWTFFSSRDRTASRSGAGVLFVFFAAVIAEVVLSSFSRGAILLMAVFLAVAASLVLGQTLAPSVSNRSRLRILIAGATLAVAIGGSMYFFQADRLFSRFQTMKQEVDMGNRNTRLLVYNSTWAMIQDQPLLGWGAGGFEYAFPGYQVRHPEIMTARDSHRRLLFEHAHNDYLEVLAEFGVIGCGVLVAALLWCLYRLARLRIWSNRPMLILLVGCLLTMTHAGFDFPLVNPAVLITWACLWPIMLRWLEIEQADPTGRRPTPPGGGETTVAGFGDRSLAGNSTGAESR